MYASWCAKCRRTSTRSLSICCKHQNTIRRSTIRICSRRERLLLGPSMHGSATRHHRARQPNWHGLRGSEGCASSQCAGRQSGPPTDRSATRQARGEREIRSMMKFGIVELVAVLAPGMIPQGEALYGIRFGRKLDYFWCWNTRSDEQPGCLLCRCPLR